MKKALFILLSLNTMTLIAQQSEIKGIISIHNSEYETGKRQYVANAQVEDDFAKATPQTTDANGNFKLVFVRIPERTSIQLIVKKEDLQVVNIDGLSAVTGQRDVVRLSMAKPDKIAEYRRQIYQVGKTEAEKNLAAQLKKKGEQIITLQKDAVKNKTAIEKLQKEYAELQAFASKIEEQAQDLARRYAPINLDDAAPLYRESFRLFQQGELAQALQILRGAGLIKQANNIFAERKNIQNIRNEADHRDSIQDQRTKDLMQVLGLKADLHKAKFEWDSVLFCLELRVNLDSTNVYNIWALAYFLSKQNKKHEATAYYQKALVLASSPELKATFLNSLGVQYSDNQKMAQAVTVYLEALKIYRQLADKNPDVFLPDLANTLNNLGEYYRVNNNMLRAEAAYLEALKIYRQLADKNPDEFLTYVAGTLNNLGIYYQIHQKMPQAEAIYLEALRIYRQLADKNPDVFLTYVAMTLNNLGTYYSDNQKMPQAEAVYLEALRIYRQLADKNPDAFLTYVAGTLDNLGTFYSSNQNMQQAEGTYLEALKFRHQLADKNPDAFLPDLAMTLNNLGVFYRDNQKMPQAEAVYLEVLKIYSQLANKNPGAFLPNLANTLNNLGEYYRVNNNMPQAETVLLEAIKISRQLLDKNPDAFLPNLANILNNLGEYYSANQKMPQAETVFLEALKINRQLSDKNPDAFLPDLAITLNNLGNYYYTNQKMLQAEAVYLEALKIRRQLSNKNPDAFLPDLATILNNLGSYYSFNQKMPQAEAAFLETLKIRRQLSDKNPDSFLPNLANTLNNLGEYYRKNNNMPQAEAAFLEAFKIYRQLANKNPNSFLPKLAITLNNLGIYFYTNHKIPQAEEANLEALKIRRQLADKNPDAFLPDLATTLNNLGAIFEVSNNYKTALEHYEEAMNIRETAILGGGIHQFNDWAQLLLNISRVKDSVMLIKDYKNISYASRLLAESCDKLKGHDEKLTSLGISEYGSLSWWALLAKDYALSEKAALRCLELDKTQEWVLTNLGHSQLLRGQFAAAKATYEKLKGKKDNEGNDYKQVLLDDLSTLEAEGITHKDFAQARAAIEKW